MKTNFRLQINRKPQLDLDQLPFFHIFFISNTKQLTNFFLLQEEPWDWLNIPQRRSNNNSSMSCFPRRWCCSSRARCARWCSPPRTCWRRTPRPTASATSAPSALSLFPRHPPPSQMYILSGLRIRIRLIRIRIQHFRLNTDPDLGFWWPKIEKNLQVEKILIFWGSKTTIYLSLGP